MRQSEITLERDTLVAAITEPEAPMSDAPVYAPEAGGVLLLLALLSPREPKEPKTP
ncbi:hypothetical protein [Streptomyces sp. NPDC088725]|uniref:hypothetical protein n=1 Tax=Streptomyces sp. NPDC088725 TaxID=3365873 RepID=UPI003818BB7C